MPQDASRRDLPKLTITPGTNDAHIAPKRIWRAFYANMRPEFYA